MKYFRAILTVGVILLVANGCGTKHEGTDLAVNCWGNGRVNCTLNKCKIFDAGVAYCASEPQPKLELEICCTGPTSATFVFACDPAGTRCLRFSEDCIPYGWKYAKQLDAGRGIDGAPLGG